MCLLAAACFVVMSLCGVAVCALADFVFEHAAKDNGQFIYWGLRIVCLAYSVFSTALLLMHLYNHSWDFAKELWKMVQESKAWRSPFNIKSFGYFMVYVVIGAALFLPVRWTPKVGPESSGKEVMVWAVVGDEPNTPNPSESQTQKT